MPIIESSMQNKATSACVLNLLHVLGSLLFSGTGLLSGKPPKIPGDDLNLIGWCTWSAPADETEKCGGEK